MSYADLDIRIEQERRRRLADQPWHYWRHSGRDEGPTTDHWCDYCAGFFGVPHTHAEKGYCHAMYREHLCACIVCWVSQDRVDAGAETVPQKEGDT